MCHITGATFKSIADINNDFYFDHGLLDMHLSDMNGWLPGGMYTLHENC